MRLVKSTEFKKEVNDNEEEKGQFHWLPPLRQASEILYQNTISSHKANQENTQIKKICTKADGGHSHDTREFTTEHPRASVHHNEFTGRQIPDSILRKSNPGRICNIMYI